ncbi:MAG: hypothetical protein LUH10_01725, partial [Tannerellaceae bacterium]|nr:hypothetical protein [Tannerellaceae bacterium]
DTFKEIIQADEFRNKLITQLENLFTKKTIEIKSSIKHLTNILESMNEKPDSLLDAYSSGQSLSPVQEKIPPQKKERQSAIVKYFPSSPDGTGWADQLGASVPEPGKTYYKFMIQGDKAFFETDPQGFDKKFINNRGEEFNHKKVCEIEELAEINENSKVLTSQKGELSLQNGKWIIIKKAKVHIK